MCTLAICKPKIRRTARVDDWIVGLGSANSPIGNISNFVVYAMKVTKVLSMEEYDTYCRENLPEKIPDLANKDFRRRVGDCIYDFNRATKPGLLNSVHTEENRQTDLGGLNVLLSEHFHYFGDNPVPLPDQLFPIVHRTPSHKSRANEKCLIGFVAWLDGLGVEKNSLSGRPQLIDKIISMTPAACRSLCSKQDRQENEYDEISRTDELHSPLPNLS
jgi:hypothetical protein